MISGPPPWPAALLPHGYAAACARRRSADLATLTLDEATPSERAGSTFLTIARPTPLQASLNFTANFGPDLPTTH